MAKVLVVYDSKTGNTQKMAEAIAEGARTAGQGITLKNVKEASLKNLEESNGIILGSPTHFGTMSDDLKKFIDESVKIRGRLEGKVGAAFTSSGSTGGGNETTLMSMIQAMLIHGMVVCGDPIETGGHYGVVAIGKPDEEALQACKKLGERVGRLASRIA